MDNLQELELLKILPSSISGDKNVQAAAKALDPELQSVSRDIREALIISRIDELPEPVLDLLAWQWHVDVYAPDLPINSKRALVKGSIPWHRKKGTLWAVKKVLQDLEVEPIIHEWFDLGTKPHTFAIEALYKGDLYQIQFMEEKIKKILWQAVEMAKPVRSHLLYLALLPPDLNDPDHGCIHDVCAWGHGLLPTTHLEIDEPQNPFNPAAEGSMTRRITIVGVYERFPRYDTCRFGHPLPPAGQWSNSTIRRSEAADRKYPDIKRSWRDTRKWPGGTWKDVIPGSEPAMAGGLLSTFTKSSAVWGHVRFDGLEAMEPRTWNVPDIGRLDEAAYAGRDGGGAGWIPIDEYFVRKESRAVSVAFVWDEITITRGETRVLSITKANPLNHSHAASSAICHSAAMIHTANERRWDAKPWGKGAWNRPIDPLTDFADATITTST